MIKILLLTKSFRIILTGFIFSISFAIPPDWEDDPGAYENTATMTIVVIINNEQMGDVGDMLAAFDNEGNVRDVALQLDIPDDFPSDYAGTILYEFQIGSNSDGDLIHFNYYDLSENLYYYSLDNYTFVTDDIIGNAVNPHTLIFDSTPQLFIFNQSLTQAFNYFNLVMINGLEVDGDDWAGTFNGDICVGARRWDTSLCGSGVCDLPAMGSDGSDETVGYLQPGDIPSFIIYDASEDRYYDAIASAIAPWENNGFNFIDSLNATVSIPGCTDEDANNFDLFATIDDGSCDYAGCTDNEACNYSVNATEDDGCGYDSGTCCFYSEENYDCGGNCTAGIDCTGDCGGSAVEDACGVCGGDNSSCTDCNSDLGGPDSDPNTTDDDAYIDNCGTCVGGNTGSIACIPDCAGTWGGSALEDNCGVCEGNDCPDDCAGTAGGNFKDDECGVCRNPSCASSGSAASYTVNICSDGEYPTNSAWNSTCTDCNGVPNGDAYLDFCAECVSGTTGNEACIFDCAGQWGGNLVDDACGTCGGSILNINDCECPQAGEERDCAGICSGLSEEDECGVCTGLDNYTAGTCNDCGGIPNGDALEDNCGDCNCGINGNYSGTSNCLIQSACKQDCLGLWGGSALEDNCGVCDTISDNDCNKDCAGTAGGNFKDDECGVCRNPSCASSGSAASYTVNICSDSEYPTNSAWNSTCTDCNGVVNGSAYIDLHCGSETSCVGGNTGSTVCIQDCAGIWSGNKVEDNCGICGGECFGGSGVECGNYDCDLNCIAELDCHGICGGSYSPAFNCSNGILACGPASCSLDIQPYLLPDEYGIERIFPNPFNPVTQVQYEISQYGQVIMRVYDLRGREVAQLINERQNPGHYAISWNAENHASGMYFIEMVIHSGEHYPIFREVRKVLYMK